jgi:D-glycero-D-manno-heptose 1,7-bisphosphate phosphatase
MSSNLALFLDRDGTISRNHYYPDSGEFEGPRSVEALELFPWSAGALSILANAGYKLFIVSNQPNFAKGKASLEDISAIHERLLAELQGEGVRLCESYYCLHHPASLIPGYSICDCRKPSPRFLFEAAAKYGLDLARSWMVGDRSSDIECGCRAGVRTIRLQPDHPSSDPRQDIPQPDHYAADLLEAARMIVNWK